MVSDKVQRKRELARLRKRKQREKMTKEQKKVESVKSCKRKDKWMEDPANRKRQRANEKKWREKRRRMFDEAEDWVEFQARMEAEESGYETDN